MYQKASHKLLLNRHLGHWISVAPWTFIVITTLVTILASLAIPFTPIVNDISDFTPYAARARAELKVYEAFFNREGNPITAFIMVRAKNNGSMLGIPQLRETVQNGLLVLTEYNNTETSMINLGYPETSVLGRRFQLDTSFFGVKVEIVDENNKHRVVSLNDFRTVNGRSILDDPENQVPDNVRDIKVVVIQLRAEKPNGFTQDDVKDYELALVEYVQSITPTYIEAYTVTPSHLTDEIVKTGLKMFPCTIIGFLVMCIFSLTTVTMSATFMSQMDYQKVILAILACVCPIMAVCTALGAMFWVGARFGSILCVTPFLVLAIGVDDSFLMMNSWQRITRSFRMYPERDSFGNPVASTLDRRIVLTLEDVGPSITITTLTNVLAFGIGALTPTPEIRLFCIGNTLAMTVDFIYQISFFTAALALLGKSETESDKKLFESNEKIVKATGSEMESVHKLLESVTRTYCKTICSWPVVFLTVLLLFGYWGLSLYGSVTIHPELRPEMLFHKDSDMMKVLEIRDGYLTPYYSTCLAFVNRPGDVDDPKVRLRLNNLVKDFERLPEALGKFSTKFWIRDYEEFLLDDEHLFDPENSTGSESDVSYGKQGKQDLIKFLQWPEFKHWNGTIHYHIEKDEKVKVDKFFFMVSFHGNQLRKWSNRAKLMHKWRQVADSYPEFEVSVYEDDAKFLDLIGTLVSQTLQSSACTLICMILVCLLFISHKIATFIATLSIFSTCLGVFGTLSLWGAELDPIVMSAVIMSIGFSVDIPAHVTYHFFKAEGTSVEMRFEKCILAIAFPVLQACFSTLACVVNILHVGIHMATVFVKTMFLVVTIGLIHGLIVIPVLLKLLSLLNRRRQIQPEQPKSVVTRNIVHVIRINPENK